MRTLPSLVLASALTAMAPSPGLAQAPAAPALTPAQIAESERLAASFDESAAREQQRLATFRGRPLGGVIQRTFDVYSNYLVVASQMMPEASYGVRPSPDVRTFGEQINHATVSHYSFCNQAGLPPGVARQGAPRLAQVTAKADIVKALKESVAYCNSVIAGATEAWLLETAPAVGGSSSGLIEAARAHALLYNNAHDAEDYGTITTYLRMAGLVPPSTAIHTPAPATRR